MQRNQPSFRTVAAIAVAAFAVYLGIYYWPAIEGFLALMFSSLVPILLGFVLAYPLNILMSFYERHVLPGDERGIVCRLRPVVSLVAALVTLVVIVAGVIVLVVPQLIDCVRLLMDELPVALTALGAWLEDAGVLTPETIDAATESLGAFDWKTGVGSAASVIMSGVVDAFLILMESPVQALVFLVFIVVLQQLEGDFIYPHVVGSSIQLPGIWVLAAVTVGGGAFGILGMFVGVPLAAIVYRLLRNDVYSKQGAGSCSS